MQCVLIFGYLTEILYNSEENRETKLTVDKNAFNYCQALAKVNIGHLDGFAHTNFQNAEANPAYTAHHIYKNNEEIVDVTLPTGTKYGGLQDRRLVGVLL